MQPFRIESLGPVLHRRKELWSPLPNPPPQSSNALVSTKIGGQPGIGFEDRIKSLAIEEAYRLITIREGDRVERIPVIQAILRKVAVAAANGDIRAQQNYLNLLIGAEADRRAATMELLKAAVGYKEHWHHVLAERARSGTTGPEPVPHPDDVLIDYETGNIRIDGPIMEDQKEARDQLRAMWPKLERELMGINEQIESDPNNLSLRKRQKELTKIVSFVRDDVQTRKVRDTIRTMQSKSSKDWSAIPDLALAKSVESGNPNTTETSSGECRWSEVCHAAASASCSRPSSWASTVVLAFALLS
jgi:Family of unknown function (DUF5681)